MTREQYDQEVAFLAMLCGSKGIAEASVLAKNKLQFPPNPTSPNRLTLLSNKGEMNNG